MINIEAYFLYQNNKLQINKNPFSLEEKQEKKWINVSDFEAMINMPYNIAEISPVGAGYISNRILENEDWQNNWKNIIEHKSLVGSLLTQVGSNIKQRKMRYS